METNCECCGRPAHILLTGIVTAWVCGDCVNHYHVTHKGDRIGYTYWLHPGPVEKDTTGSTSQLPQASNGSGYALVGGLA